MPSTNTLNTNSEKFEFINGTRGIAALQVVLLHYAAFFLPGFSRVQKDGHFLWESALTNSPLYFLIDGQNAVSIFFIMSGFVLTPAFSNAAISIQRNVAKRFIRLFLPVSASVLLSMLLIVFLGGEHISASDVTGSSWARSLVTVTPSLTQTLRDIFLNSMVIGYQSVSYLSVFPSINEHLTPVIQSPNSPMWTLHIELWGSMLILAICIMHRKLQPTTFWCAFAATALFLGSSRYNLFLIGFIFYINRNFFLNSHSRLRDVIAFLFVAIGIFISASRSSYLPDIVLSVLKEITFTNQDTSSELKTEITALLIFTGIMLSSHIKNLMKSRFAQFAGSLSFSIYLIHFPILFTITAFLFNRLNTSIGYLPSALCSSLIGLFVTLLLSKVFNLYIDTWSIKISRSISFMRIRSKKNASQYQ